MDFNIKKINNKNMDTCAKCGMPMEADSSCSCNQVLCYHCCACDSDCVCGCSNMISDFKEEDENEEEEDYDDEDEEEDYKDDDDE